MWTLFLSGAYGGRSSRAGSIQVSGTPDLWKPRRTAEHDPFVFLSTLVEMLFSTAPSVAGEFGCTSVQKHASEVLSNIRMLAYD